jgi:alpha-beta hydrolase superfamily lysophospholipase
MQTPVPQRPNDLAITVPASKPIWRWDFVVFFMIALSLNFGYRALMVSSAASPARETLEPELLYRSQLLLTTYEWEWVLVRIDEVYNLPLEAFGTDLPDPEITLDVSADLPSDIDFSGTLNTFVWPIKWNSPVNSSSWERIGMAAYLKGTAETMALTIIEKNQVDQDYVIARWSVSLPPPDLENWTNVTLIKDELSSGIRLEIAVKRMTRPLFTEQDHLRMGLKEYLIALENGELASLVHNTSGNNDKAVLYFAGRADSFAHPHVLDLYKSKGYDFYALDPRRSGRARRFLKNPFRGNDVDDFVELFEDVDLAMHYIRRRKNYSLVVAHCHSNGALVALSYLMKKKDILMKSLEPDFDGFVLNSPFLDWGHVGGTLNEYVLKNAGLITMINPDLELYGYPGLNDWWTKVWLLYRWNLAWKPVLTNALTSRSAKATSDLHRKLGELPEYLLTKPTLVLSSKSDDVLDNQETLSLVTEKNIHSHPTLVEFDFQCHDVTKSHTHDLNDQALNSIGEWLDDLEVYHTLH